MCLIKVRPGQEGEPRVPIRPVTKSASVIEQQSLQPLPSLEAAVSLNNKADFDPGARQHPHPSRPQSQQQNQQQQGQAIVIPQHSFSYGNSPVPVANSALNAQQHQQQQQQQQQPRQPSTYRQFSGQSQFSQSSKRQTQGPRRSGSQVYGKSPRQSGTSLRTTRERIIVVEEGGKRREYSRRGDSGLF